MRHTDQIQALQVQQVSQDGEMVVNDVKQRKTATSTFYVFILFFFRYLPNYCSFVAYVSLCRPNATLKLFYLYSCSLLYLNSSLNPVIYCWKMIQVRRGTVRTLQNIFLRRNWTEGSYETALCKSILIVLE